MKRYKGFFSVIYLKQQSKLLYSAEQAKSSKESLKMFVYVYFIKLHYFNHITYISLKAFAVMLQI